VAGRGAPAGLVLNDNRLSRQHFRVQIAAGDAVLEDLRSRNGTFVNGTRAVRCWLRDGDIIEAGGQVFVFLNKLPD
jgi:pSer/pThr/pTyr-binding forkhead associated (FHA) protein